LIMLDANFTNNSWTSNTDDTGPWRVATQFALFFQHAVVSLTGAL
jgi:hypothetical protein